MVDLSEVKSQLEQPDVAAEAVFRGTNLSEGAQRLKDLKANKGPREFLDAYNMNKPFEVGAGAAANEKMGLERNAAGIKNRTGAEALKYAEAKSEVELIEKYLEKGPDSITPGSTEETKIMEYFDRAIVLWPEAAAMSKSDRDAYIKKKLKDPRFLARVKEAYEGSLKNAEAFDEGVTGKEGDYRQAERTREASQRELRKIKKELSEVNSDFSLFGKDSKGNPNPRQKLLDDSIKDGVVSEEALKNIAKQIESNVRQAQNLRGKLRGVTRADPSWTKLEDLEEKITNLESDKNDHIDKVASMNQLKQEYAELKARKTKAEDDEFRVQGELDEAKYKEATARAIWEDAKNTRSTQEQKYVDGLQRVFYNAALEDISANIKENEEYRREELQKLKDQIGDQGAKTVLEGVKDRWTNVIKDGSGKIKKIELQKGKIEQDYYTLLNEGPQGMLRQMLTDAKDSSGNAIFNDTEIELKLNDPAFVAAAESEFVATLLRKRLQTSKITEGESNLLFDRFGDKIMDSALAKNDLATGMIDKLKEKNGFKGSRKEFMKKMMKNPKTYGGMAAILALLLGSPFILAGGMAAAGAYSTAVGAVA